MHEAPTSPAVTPTVPFELAHPDSTTATPAGFADVRKPADPLTGEPAHTERQFRWDNDLLAVATPGCGCRLLERGICTARCRCKQANVACGPWCHCLGGRKCCNPKTQCAHESSGGPAAAGAARAPAADAESVGDGDGTASVASGASAGQGDDGAGVGPSALAGALALGVDDDDDDIDGPDDEEETAEQMGILGVLDDEGDGGGAEHGDGPGGEDRVEDAGEDGAEAGDEEGAEDLGPVGGGGDQRADVGGANSLLVA